MPTMAAQQTVESEMELKKDAEDISMAQQENTAKTENVSVSNASETSVDDSSELTLKRKTTEEHTSNKCTVDSSNKKPRNDTQEVDRQVMEMTEIQVETEDVYSLLVSNFPENWSFPQICNFVSQSLEGVSVEMEPVANKNELRLTLNSAEHMLTAQNALENKEVDGNKLKVIVEGLVESGIESPGLNQDIWETDPKGLYGLKPEFLKNLNITPPIGNWVNVCNFRCDKNEIREVFELAGHVVVCSAVNLKEKFAKIMYSHPLEAVQAVSMLHNQVFYGMKLNVTMDKGTQMLLPKGLVGIGPGLGEDGNPVREIIREYERFVSGKSTRINQSLFTAGNINGIVVCQKNNFETFYNIDKTDTQTSTTPTTSTTPPIVSTPNSTPTVRANYNRQRPNFGNARGQSPHDPNHYRFPKGPMFRGPMQRGPMGPMGEMRPPGPFHRGFPPGPPRMPYGPRPMHDMMRPTGPMHPQGPMHPSGPIRPPGPMHPAGSIPGPGPIHPAGPIHPPGSIPTNAPMPEIPPNWGNIQPVGLRPQMSKCLDPTALTISHLPPTTSFPSLCGKLSTLAQVTSLEFTTPGCAVVKFASPNDAEKCLQTFHTIELS